MSRFAEVIVGWELWEKKAKTLEGAMLEKVAQVNLRISRIPWSILKRTMLLI